MKEANKTLKQIAGDLPSRIASGSSDEDGDIKVEKKAFPVLKPGDDADDKHDATVTPAKSNSTVPLTPTIPPMVPDPIAKSAEAVKDAAKDAVKDAGSHEPNLASPLAN